MTVEQQAFGRSGKQPITRYIIKNEQGFQVSCINYSCIITEILAPEQTGKMENVVLGFDTLEEYERDVHYFGTGGGAALPF